MRRHRNYLGNLLKRYAKDTEGTFIAIWGLCFVVLVIGIGVTVDLTRQMHAKQKAQSIADSIGLAAAVYVNHNGAPPQSSDDGFVHGQPYTAAELGYDFMDANNVTFTVLYDDAKKEAKVVTGGSLNTMFMQIAGHQELGFKAGATAKYKDVDSKDPASIVFVLDNSGSMSFDDLPVAAGEWEGPDEAVRRIDALKDVMTSFNDKLIALGANDDHSTPEGRFLRTGMLPYNENIISNRVVNMHWGTLDQGNNIDNMWPNGSTNSSPPMTEAWTWLQNEQSIHTSNSGKSPLRVVIFMTDGKNTIGNNIWVEEEDTNHWRRPYTRTRCNWWRCWQFTDHEYYPTDGPSPIPIEEPDGDGWTEGKIYFSSNYETQTKCQEMHAAGVKVYTIGFALEAGTYETNWNDPEYVNVTPDTKQKATALLSACASEGDNFILAEDAASLEAAFERIGNDIIEELIRLSN